MADHSFVCGDILRCVSTYYAQQLNIEGQHGIVMGTKPHHIHLWFEVPRRSFWLTYDILKRVDDFELSPLLNRIQTLSRSLKAEEWELEETEKQYKLICYIEGVSLETLLELRSYLDIDYDSLLLYPEGMGRLIAQFQWSK